MGEMDECAYCDVLAGRAASPPLGLDDAEVVSFMGRYQPTGPGYSLVVPRVHIDDLHKANAAQLASLFRSVQRVSRAVVRAFGVTGTTILQNNGPPGQRVRHLHFHVVPRHPDDGYPRESKEEVPLTELARQAEILRRHLYDEERP